MKIQYKKKRLNHALIFGTLWLIISILGIFFKEKPSWTDYSFLVISLLYLTTYFYEKTNQYLTITNGTISVNQPFGKRVKLSDIKRIKKFAGDYILITDKTTLKINTQMIRKNSLLELDKELEKLDLKGN